MRVVLHHGLALLSLLIAKGFVTETMSDELRQTQTRCHLERDTSSCEFELVVHAGSHEAHRAFYTTIGVFISMDDDTLLPRARWSSRSFSKLRISAAVDVSRRRLAPFPD